MTAAAAIDTDLGVLKSGKEADVSLLERAVPDDPTRSCVMAAKRYRSTERMYLARVRPAELEDLAAYEYLVAAPTLADPDVEPEWSRTWAPTACLFDDVPNEMSAAWNDHLGCYVSLTTYRRENIMVMRTAPQMWGPWSEPEVVHRLEKTNERSLFNAGKEHPEFARDGGRVTYMTFIDSEVYVPHLIEITYA